MIRQTQTQLPAQSAAFDRLARASQNTRIAFHALLLSVFTCAAVVAPHVAGAEEREENASNPLAAVNNIDFRWQTTFIGNRTRNNPFIDGAFMATPKLKLKYELHYVETNITGSSEKDVEKVLIKPIYFAREGLLNETWGTRLALGFDLVYEFDNEDKGIGTGADQFAPFVGMAFANRTNGTTIIPLVQHFTGIAGDTDLNQTALRVIALKPFGEGYWAKLDTKIPYDWENDRWPISTEIQIGYNISERVALYADALIGIGNERPYDAGVGVGLRIKY